MTWEIEWTERAIKDGERLDPVARRRVLRAIERLAQREEGDVKRLVGRGGELRLRVGNWRVRFAFDHAAGALRILRVLPRDRAYRD